MFLITIVVASSNCSTDPSDYFIYDGFENTTIPYDSNLWDRSVGNNASMTRETTIVNAGDSSMKLTNSFYLEQASYTEMSEESAITQEVWMYLTASQSDALVNYITDGATYHYWEDSNLQHVGEWSIYESGEQDSDVAVATNTWINLRTYIEEGVLAEYYLDDVLIYTDDSGTTIDLDSILLKAVRVSSAHTVYYDDFRMYSGRVCTYTDTSFSASDWNVTSANSVNDTRTVWNTEGYADIKSDLLSFTVTTSEATNMSCRLGVNEDYASMIVVEENYKATTTETTSHSYTLYDSIPEGNSSIYCSFVNSTGGEVLRSHLKVTKYTTRNNLGVYSFESEDISFNSGDYVTISNNTFNISSTQEGVLFSAFNLYRTHDLDADVVGRLALDGVVLQEDLLRTVSQYAHGATGFDPTLMLLSAGEHHLSLEMARIGVRSVYVQNIDLELLIVSDTSDNHSIGYNFTRYNLTQKYDEVTVDQVYKANKLVNSGTFFWDGRKVLTYDAPARYINIFVSTFGALSQIAGRTTYVESTGSMMQGAYFSNEDAFTGVGGLVNTTNITHIVNGSSLLLSDRDENFDLIVINQTSNTTTDGETTLSFTAGKHLLMEQTFPLSVNQPLTHFLSVTARATTGIENYTILLEQGACEAKKYRGFSNEGEIGNSFLYQSCNSSETDIKVSILVAPGNEVTIIDEVLISMDTALGFFAEEPSPPLAMEIITPVNESTIKGQTYFEWGAFSDPNQDLDHYNFSVYNASFVKLAELDTTNTLPYLTLNASGLYDEWGAVPIYIEVEGVDSGGLTANTINYYLLAPPSLNISGLSPENNSIIGTQSGTFSFDLEEVALCDLYLNDTFIASLHASIGTNTFSSVSLVLNESTWYVYCANATLDLSGSSEVYQFTVEEATPTVFGLMDNTCPETLPNMLLFVGMIFFMFAVWTVLMVLGVEIIASACAVFFAFIGLIMIGCNVWLGAFFFVLMLGLSVAGIIRFNAK